LKVRGDPEPRKVPTNLDARYQSKTWIEHIVSKANFEEIGERQAQTGACIRLEASDGVLAKNKIAF
jgi:hypothetical protein